jgi:hypothetical protein
VSKKSVSSAYQKSEERCGFYLRPARAAKEIFSRGWTLSPPRVAFVGEGANGAPKSDATQAA